MSTEIVLHLREQLGLMTQRKEFLEEKLGEVMQLLERTAPNAVFNAENADLIRCCNKLCDRWKQEMGAGVINVEATRSIRQAQIVEEARSDNERYTST